MRVTFEAPAEDIAYRTEDGSLQVVDEKLVIYCGKFFVEIEPIQEFVQKLIALPD